MEPSYRDRIMVAIVIVGVFCFALTPALYLISRALHWETALQVVEIIFFPSFVLFGAGALFAYRRSQARRALLDQDHRNGQF